MTRKSLFILGRQPAIGRAELESVLSAGHVEPVGEHAMASDLPPGDIPFARLGGSMRLARVVGTVPAVSWPELARYAVQVLPSLLDTLPLEGKLKLGLSTFGLPVRADQLLRTGLELKKVCKKAERSVRVAPSKEPALNSAQVLHNQLTGDLGIELVFVSDGKQTMVGKTMAVQDIEAYTHRDLGRPKRDARVGMLPPKLAQTIVNLAAGPLEPNAENTVLDPFCGTGVVLQEALLMGYGAYGTDLEPRMIDYTRTNLEWLATHSTQGADDPMLEVGDATDHQWQHPFSAVACETYLGRPLNAWPDSKTLQEIMGTCNVITERFLRNIAAQIPKGARLCLAVPAWQAPNGRLYHLRTLDQLDVLGYNRVSFSWAQNAEMIYHRPGQLVARELIVVTRK